jgi:hypothetical protein
MRRRAPNGDEKKTNETNDNTPKMRPALFLFKKNVRIEQNEKARLIPKGLIESSINFEII